MLYFNHSLRALSSTTSGSFTAWRHFQNDNEQWKGKFKFSIEENDLRGKVDAILERVSTDQSLVEASFSVLNYDKNKKFPHCITV